MPVADIVKDVDLVLVTHTHEDHFDKVASSSLDKTREVMIQPADKEYFQKEGFTSAAVIEASKLWNGITIYRVEGEHGTGEALKMMGRPSIYKISLYITKKL
jgi:L-ascorbate metabolism protein UlaG (beta-lactamase superfamily)